MSVLPAPQCSAGSGSTNILPQTKGCPSFFLTNKDLMTASPWVQTMKPEGQACAAPGGGQGACSLSPAGAGPRDEGRKRGKTREWPVELGRGPAGGAGGARQRAGRCMLWLSHGWARV